MDQQKAFDTINHKIFSKKLEAIGSSEKCMRRFHSYLANEYSS